MQNIHKYTKENISPIKIQNTQTIHKNMQQIQRYIPKNEKKKYTKNTQIYTNICKIYKQYIFQI